MSTPALYRAIPAKPTRYRRVLMRSRLEATAAKILDGYKIPWKYEPARFHRNFVKGSGYVPDFRLWPRRSTDPWFLEIKPVGLYDPDDPDGLHAALDKMSVIRVVHPGAVFALWLVDSPIAEHGALLINLPGSDWWHGRPGTFLRSLAHAHTPRRRRMLWSR